MDGSRQSNVDGMKEFIYRGEHNVIRAVNPIISSGADEIRALLFPGYTMLCVMIGE